MRAVDTNVLVRLIIRDDARQTVAADAFIESGAWVPVLVLAETTWVLDAVYDFTANRIATAVEMLLDHRSLTLQETDTVRDALMLFRRRPSLGFSDCLLVETARGAGHLPFGTFDRELAKVSGCEQL